MTAFTNKYFSTLITFCLFSIILFYIFYIPTAAQHAEKKDFMRFYQASTAYWQQQNIYKPTINKVLVSIKPEKTQLYTHHDNLASPFFILLFLPFALVKSKTAFIVWSYLNLAMCLASLRIILHEYQLFTSESLLGRFCLLLGFICYPIYSNTLFGQVGALLLFLLTISWYSWRQQHRSKLGFYLGIASLIKPFFGLFGLLFLLQKNWRGMTSYTMTFLLGLLLSTLIFGKSIYLTYFHILQQAHWYTSSLNFSLLGFYSRVFGIAHETNQAYWPIAHLSIILTALSSLLLLVGLYRLQRKTVATSANELVFGYTSISMLLISPLCWQYYLPLLILPSAILLRRLYYPPYTAKLAILTAIAIVLLNIPVENLRPAQVVKDYRIWLDFAYSFYALVLLAWVSFKLGTVKSVNDQRACV